MTIKEKLPLDTPRVEVRKPLTVAGLRKRYNAKTVTNIHRCGGNSNRIGLR